MTVANVAADQPLFVDFQLRPRNPDHLWFAYNVLDWPADKQGQIQDADNRTFADLPRGPGDPPPAANDTYGDLKLVPMLEIRIKGNNANLPPQSALTPYNIFTTTPPSSSHPAGFSNVTVDASNALSANAAFVATLYNDFLKRAGDTTNANDGIFARANLLTPTKSGDGYGAAVNLDIKGA